MERAEATHAGKRRRMGLSTAFNIRETIIGGEMKGVWTPRLSTSKWHSQKITRERRNWSSRQGSGVEGKHPQTQPPQKEGK